MGCGFCSRAVVSFPEVTGRQREHNSLSSFLALIILVLLGKTVTMDRVVGLVLIFSQNFI